MMSRGKTLEKVRLARRKSAGGYHITHDIWNIRQVGDVKYAATVGRTSTSVVI